MADEQVPQPAPAPKPAVDKDKPVPAAPPAFMAKPYSDPVEKGGKWSFVYHGRSYSGFPTKFAAASKLMALTARLPESICFVSEPQS